MSSITFDIQPFFTELKEAGFDDQQAEAVINTFKKVYEDADLATKSDIKDLRQEMRHEIREVRHEMREMRYQIIISLGGMIAVAVAILAALIKMM